MYVYIFEPVPSPARSGWRWNGEPPVELARVPEERSPSPRFAHSMHPPVEHPLQRWLRYPRVGLILSQDRVELLVDLGALRHPQFAAPCFDQAIRFGVGVIDEILAARRNLGGVEQRERI